MNDEQIKEVMRLADEIADYAWKQGLSDGSYSQADHDRKSCDASRAALEAHLRTIGEPAGYSLPAGSIGAKKFAQVGGGFTPVGLVFSKGESAMAISEHGRVYWDRNLVHPISGEPESVNAELMVALKAARVFMQHAESCGDSPSYNHEPDACGCGAEHAIDFVESAIARAESAIETPAKVSPCAGHAVQQEADTCRDWPEDFHHENGQYMNTCHVCKNTFIGHKRRAVCKVCNNGFIRAQQEADEAGGAA